MALENSPPFSSEFYQIGVIRADPGRDPRKAGLAIRADPGSPRQASGVGRARHPGLVSGMIHGKKRA